MGVLSQELPLYELLAEQVNIESRGKHMVNKDSIITSPKGAVGVAQFMPSTWEWLKYSNKIPDYYNIMNEDHQRIAHIIYMKYLLSVDYGIEDSINKLAFASYNAGVNRVKSLVRKYGSDWTLHLPTETKHYLKQLSL